MIFVRCPLSSRIHSVANVKSNFELWYAQRHEKFMRAELSVMPTLCTIQSLCLELMNRWWYRWIDVKMYWSGTYSSSNWYSIWCIYQTVTNFRTFEVRTYHQYRNHSTKSNLLFASIVSLHYWYERNSFKIKSLSFFVIVIITIIIVVACYALGYEMRCCNDGSNTRSISTWISRNFASVNFRFHLRLSVFWQWMSLYSHCLRNP